MREGPCTLWRRLRVLFCVVYLPITNLMSPWGHINVSVTLGSGVMPLALALDVEVNFSGLLTMCALQMFVLLLLRLQPYRPVYAVPQGQNGWQDLICMKCICLNTLKGHFCHVTFGLDDQFLGLYVGPLLGLACFGLDSVSVVDDGFGSCALGGLLCRHHDSVCILATEAIVQDRPRPVYFLVFVGRKCVWPAHFWILFSPFTSHVSLSSAVSDGSALEQRAEGAVKPQFFLAPPV